MEASNQIPMQLKNDLNLRTQFTFIANDPTLACILKNIASNSVNISGFFLTKDRQKNNFCQACSWYI